MEKEGYLVVGRHPPEGLCDPHVRQVPVAGLGLLVGWGVGLGRERGCGWGIRGFRISHLVVLGTSHPPLRLLYLELQNHDEGQGGITPHLEARCTGQDKKRKKEKE